MGLGSTFPEPGARAPRRGTVLLRKPARLVLDWWGWRVVNRFPDLAQAVVIVAPHTSNWDFPLGMVVIFALGMRVSWLGKHAVFRWPASGLMRSMGGIPVDRSAPSGVVAQIVAEFRSHDELILALSPEGTRTAVTQWKTGFWRIAREAGVPIVAIYFDYGTKTVGFYEPFVTTADCDGDVAALQAAYAGVAARHPAGAPWLRSWKEKLALGVGNMTGCLQLVRLPTPGPFADRPFSSF